MRASDAERLARATLMRLAEPGDPAVHAFVERVGPTAAVRAIEDGSAPLKSLTAYRARLAPDEGFAPAGQAAALDLRRSGSSGVRLVVPGDLEWPSQLGDLALPKVDNHPASAPPLGLWVRGPDDLRKAALASVLEWHYATDVAPPPTVVAPVATPLPAPKPPEPRPEPPAPILRSEPRPAAVKAFWIDQNHRGQAVYHFEGCASISEAEKFRGMDILIPFAQRVTLPVGRYFVSDLVGCSVFESSAEPPVVSSSPCSLADAPALIGAVSDVQMTGENVAGTPFLVVDTKNGELLIPLAADICTRIDPAARRIDVVLPEGLRDLNRGV